MRSLFKITVIYISISALFFSQTIPVYAGFIDTDQFMSQHYADQDREFLRKNLERDEARNLLSQYGVSTEQAQERINALTNKEVRMFSQQFKQLPAAGHGGTVAVLLLLLLLLILLGLSR